MPRSSGVMDNVTHSPCEGAVHRLQMLRQVSVLTSPCPLLRGSCPGASGPPLLRRQ